MWRTGRFPSLLTAANVHDAKLAIPMTKLTTARVTYLYELMDAVYDAAALREHRAQLGMWPSSLRRNDPAAKHNCRTFRKEAGDEASQGSAISQQDDGRTGIRAVER